MATVKRPVRYRPDSEVGVCDCAYCDCIQPNGGTFAFGLCRDCKGHLAYARGYEIEEV